MICFAPTPRKPNTHAVRNDPANLVIPTAGDLTECVTRPVAFKDESRIATAEEMARLVNTARYDEWRREYLS